MGWKDPILEEFSINEELVKTCGWTWWHENVLAISDRPEFIRRDTEGRLHCEDGPSMRYRDGWSLYNWHGVAVDGDWIEDRSALTPKIALEQKNIEKRRAACEMLGWHNILRELGGHTINRDDDPEIGELVEVSLPDNGPQKFLRVLCATKREFAIPVPLEMKTALQANAWTYGIDEFKSFNPEVRT